MEENGKTFSRSVKEELLDVIPRARHCAVAELLAISRLEGGRMDGEELVLISTEAEGLARKVFTLLQKAFNIIVEISKHQRKRTGKTVYEIRTGEARIKSVLLRALAVPDLHRQCCARAFLRGAFCAAGTVSDPDRYYRLEIVCRNKEDAALAAEVMDELGLEPKQTVRKGGFVVYLQDGNGISRALALMDAPHSVLSLENTRVMREMRGSVSRRLNCEMSNLGKTAQAAAKQIRDIQELRQSGILARLPENLRVTAVLREQNPEASLTELGELMEPAVGRSGVNHRLRKLSQIADEMRSGQTASGVRKE